MTEPSILSRIKKLLRLAADPSNPHEAALAAERAQALLFKHKLALADLSALDEAVAGVVEINRPYIKDQWRRMLAAVLTRYNFCRVLEWPGGFKFIGTKQDLDVVMYLYIYLARSIIRMTRDAWEARVHDLTDDILGPHPALKEEGAEASWKDSFRIGVVEVIGVRLQRLRQQQEDEAAFEQRALVGPTKDALVRASTAVQRWGSVLDDYITQKYGKVTEKPPEDFELSMDGFTRGAHAGKTLPISRGLGGATDRRRLT